MGQLVKANSIEGACSLFSGREGCALTSRSAGNKKSADRDLPALRALQVAPDLTLLFTDNVTIIYTPHSNLKKTGDSKCSTVP